MKKFLLSGFVVAGLLASHNTYSQSYSIPDTVAGVWMGPGAQNFEAAITNKSTGALKLNWQVFASNFPSDWLGYNLGICDNIGCRTDGTSSLWNGTTNKGAMQSSGDYNPGFGDFHLQLDLSSAKTTGTYYLKVATHDSAGTENDTVTFIISKTPTAVPTVTKNENDIVVYPNPATSQLNVLFNQNDDIKNIAIYNVIGKVVSVYRVNGNSAGMDISNLPSGVYFLRLVNSQGNVVTTCRFTHQ